MEPDVQYYALTKFNTTKEDPFAVARKNNGIFEIYRKGAWVEEIYLADMLIGEFNDYEDITKSEATAIIERQARKYVQ